MKNFLKRNLLDLITIVLWIIILVLTTHRDLLFLPIICLLIAHTHIIINNEIIADYRYNQGNDKNDFSKEDKTGRR